MISREGFKRLVETGIDLTPIFEREVGIPIPQGGSAETWDYAGRDVYKVSRPNVARSIDNIVVSYGGAFSNSLIQLSNAINLAISLDIRNIYLPGFSHDPVMKESSPFWYLNEGRHEYYPGKFVINEPCDVDRIEGTSIIGNFFGIEALVPMMKPFYPMAHLLLKPFFNLNFQGTDLTDDDLVLYLRSGNAFTLVPCNTGIAQPPLEFYRQVVDSRKWSRISLVFEDKENPVIDPLIDYCASTGIPFRCHSGNLRDDIEILLGARHVTMSRGTFISGVLSISDHIKTVYDFAGSYLRRLARDDVKVVIGVDVSGGYLDAMYRRNWNNTPEQRSLMVEYDDVRLELPQA